MKSRFTIRDLFWLTAVVALAIGWGLDWSKLRAMRAELNAEAQSLTQQSPTIDPQLAALPTVTRRLAGRRRAELVSALTAMGANAISIFSLGNNADSRQYANEFADVFKEANWHVATAGNFLMGPPIAGLTLVVPSQGDDPLARTFLACEIPMTIVPGQTYQLRVGR